MQKGFTLVEILITLAILTFVVSLATVVDLNSFKTDTAQSERDKIVSILEKARSRAMANFYDSSHGVCYDSGNYIIFKGETCDPSSIETIPASTDITINFPTVVFTRLTGDTTSANISLTNDNKSLNIEINNEGTINW